MPELSLAVRVSKQGDDVEQLLDALDERLQQMGLGEVEGWMSGLEETIAFVELKKTFTRADLPRQLERLQGALAEVGLGDIARAEIPTNDDSDDDEE